MKELWNCGALELDSLVGQAVQSNLSLQQAQASILQAREARAIAGAGLWPSVNLSGNNTTSNNSGASETSAGAAESSSGSTSNLFQSNLYTSEDALVQSNRTVDTDLIALYKALGGGWE